jgi:hypothetical protein
MGDLRKEILCKIAKLPLPQFEFKLPQKDAKEMPNFETLPWDAFWDSQHRTEDGFLVYRAGPAAESSSVSQLRPYIFLLHGAGYTSLSWSLVAVCPYNTYLLRFNHDYSVIIYCVYVLTSINDRFGL